MSRTDARTDPLRRRPARTIPAVIVALVLLAGGVALVWAAVLRLSSGSWSAAAGQTGSWLAALSWGSTALLLVTIACAVIGLILLIAAIKPGAPTALRLAAADGSGQTSTETVMTRSSVAKLATARARTVDAVEGATATVSARKVNVTVKTASADRGGVEQQVHRQVAGALAAAGLQPVPAVRVSVRTQQA